MILKYTKHMAKEGGTLEAATSGFQTCVISGIDRYEFGHFREKEVSSEKYETEMYITFHREKQSEQEWQNVTVKEGCSAFIMSDEGKTIERIR